MRHFTWKLESVSNIWWAIAGFYWYLWVCCIAPPLRFSRWLWKFIRPSRVASRRPTKISTNIYLSFMKNHCVKSVQIRNFSGLYFSLSDWTRRDNPYLSVFSPNVGKYGQEKTPYLNTFHAVEYLWGSLFLIKLRK